MIDIQLIASPPGGVGRKKGEKMKTVRPKAKQKTLYVVRAGSKAVYRGDNVREASNVARAHGERATVTFKTDSAVSHFLNYR